MKAQHELLTSIPGIGDQTSFQLLAELSDLRRFTNVRQVVALVGLNPQQRHSGRSTHLYHRLDRPLSAAALHMAIQQRGLPELHHSGHGTQYTSGDYLHLLKGVTLSMNHTGNCYDNAMKESFWGTLKTECADQLFESRAAARLALFDYIEYWYNRQRLHSALGYRTPVAFEQAFTTSTT